MRKTKFQRITAFAVALVLLLCGGVGVSAADSDSSVTDTSISDIRELLNAISYTSYLEDNADVDRATEEVVIDATKNYEFKFSKNAEAVYTQDTALGEDVDKSTVAHIEEYDGVKGLYVPGNGIVSWKTDAIKSAAKYSVVIDYYPVQNKAASIERVFMINGAVPFAEARYLTISKV
ncbi:MAG: hypothetical protein IJV72_06895, partial [Clostridia bacterium]|nr:hypothetical protein [Clostridia bacterium]